jgi:hypothetical protein
MFALQHSIMARPFFKRFIPASAERSTFVLAGSLALGLLFWKWQPVGGVKILRGAVGRLIRTGSPAAFVLL